MSVNYIKNIYNFIELNPKPSFEELDRFYRETYYQESKGVYQKKYSVSEKKYITYNLKRVHACIEKLFKKDVIPTKFLDIGCGEGWALNYFSEQHWDVHGVDLSSHGLKTFHPELLNSFSQMDALTFLLSEKKKGNRYDVINLYNVIEHVAHPDNLITEIKHVLNENGIIIITYPNDFSPFQTLLTSLGKIEKEFWVVYPDHISYFNKKSFTQFVNQFGFDVMLTLAEFPIDIFLLNDHSNYISDKTKGKQAHIARVECMNFLSELNFHESLEAFLHFGEMGFGRDLVAFLQLKK